jgi:hypothetical protein
MPLIEEKIGIGFAGIIRTNVAPAALTLRPLREMFHATAQRNRNVGNASL